MNVPRQFTALVLSIGMLASIPAGAWQSSAAARASVPQLMNFAGELRGHDGRPASGVVGVTFLIYEEEKGGAPLWLETQNVTLDAAGHFSITLGVNTPEGLPPELFASKQARWLAVEPQGMPTPARVMLLSVPYALKARDAETIGGLPPSAFLRAGAAPQANLASPQVSAESAATPPVTGTGNINFIPRWTSNGSSLGNSALFQSGTGSAAKIGINTGAPAAVLDINGTVIARGALQLPSRGTATSAKGWSSQPFTLQASAFSSSTHLVIAPKFQWEAEPLANNTASPAGTLNLLYGIAGTPKETGLKIAANGQITFAPGQLFPGTGAVTGVKAGTGLTGGGTTGSLTLGVDTTKVPLLNSANTFTAPITFAAGQAFPGTGTITGITAGTGLSGGGTSGAVSLSLNTTYSDGRYAQLGAANTFSGIQTINNRVGIGVAPSYPLHVMGTIRSETGLSLGGDASVVVDAPGVIGGRFFISSNGNVGISNINPESTLDVGGNISASGAIIGTDFYASGASVFNGDITANAGITTVGGITVGTGLNVKGSLQIQGDTPMNAAPHMYFTAYLPGPLGADTTTVPIFTVPSKPILITRLVANGLSTCAASGALTEEVRTFDPDTDTFTTVYVLPFTNSSSAVANSGLLSIPIPAGIDLSVAVHAPNCGTFGTPPSNDTISVEYVMQ